MSTSEQSKGIARLAARKAGEDVVTTDKKGSSKNYKGFVAGVFSGVAKLSGKLLSLVCAATLEKYYQRLFLASRALSISLVNLPKDLSALLVSNSF
jgi:hypothetical protein